MGKCINCVQYWQEKVLRLEQALKKIANYDSFGTCFETKRRIVNDLQEIASETLKEEK